MRIRDLLKSAGVLLEGAAEGIEREAVTSFGAGMGDQPGDNVLWLLPREQRAAECCQNETKFCQFAERAREIGAQLQAALDRQNIGTIPVDRWSALADALDRYRDSLEADALASCRREARHLLTTLDRLGRVLEDQRDGSEDLLTVSEVARRLQVNLNVVDQLVRSGNLKAVEVGKGTGQRRRLRISRPALELWIQQNTVQARNGKSKRRTTERSQTRQWIE